MLRSVGGATKTRVDLSSRAALYIHFDILRSRTQKLGYADNFVGSPTHPSRGVAASQNNLVLTLTHIPLVGCCLDVCPSSKPDSNEPEVLNV